LKGGRETGRLGDSLPKTGSKSLFVVIFISDKLRQSLTVDRGGFPPLARGESLANL
jgi:hypothetical protein